MWIDNGFVNIITNYWQKLTIQYCIVHAGRNWQFSEMYYFRWEIEGLQIHSLEIDFTFQPFYSALQKIYGNTCLSPVWHGKTLEYYESFLYLASDNLVTYPSPF